MKHTMALFVALPAMVLLMSAEAGWADAAGVDNVDLRQAENTGLEDTLPRGARGPARSMAAVRTDTPPIIDGKLDDACWSQANIATDFTDYRIEQLAVDQTLVRVLYDDQNLYIAFECLEPDPNSIVGVERRYDQSLSDEDSVVVRLDTFHDHRCTYIFGVNTLGTRYDARMGLFDRYDDDTWGCDWSAACTVEKDRWFAEMAIPIGNMLFEPKDAVTWGANFYRRERSIPERTYWCYRNSRARYPPEYGHLTNLDLAKVEVNRKPAFETYLSGTSDFEGNTNKLSTGLDISMRLNSELTSALTIFPDFGQVEADPDTIELRDTERFLRERRPFFREGNELFQSPLNIYYSRRFMDIDAGAKITGQGASWALGLLDVQGEIEREDKMSSGNYHVGRFIYNVRENSHIGGIWANSTRSDGTNITGGFDTRLFLNSTTAFTAQFLGLRDSKGIETDGIFDHDAYGLYTALRGGTQPVSWRVDYRDISQGFRPDLGYIPRRDIRGPGSSVRYRDYFEQGIFKSISASSEIDFYENHDHDTTLRDFIEQVGVGFRNEVELSYTRGDKFHAPYQNWYDRFIVQYNEDVDVWESVSVGFERGVYEKEPYKEYSLEKPMRITERLLTTVNGNYRTIYPEAGGEEAVWLWRWITQYTFTWNGRIKFTAEQTSEGRHNLTTLFSWPVRDNMDLYLLFNDYETDGQDVSAAFFKVVYRF
ncbi:MAG: carbohydrate binding family 9 domain-containing protein [Planctomycetota bacterium]|jgi:hypothetical protein